MLVLSHRPLFWLSLRRCSHQGCNSGHPNPGCLNSSQAAGKGNLPPRLWGAATHAPVKGWAGGRGEEVAPGDKTTPIVQAGHIPAMSLPPLGSFLLLPAPHNR